MLAESAAQHATLSSCRRTTTRSQNMSQPRLISTNSGVDLLKPASATTVAVHSALSHSARLLYILLFWVGKRRGVENLHVADIASTNGRIVVDQTQIKWQSHYLLSRTRCQYHRLEAPHSPEGNIATRIVLRIAPSHRRRRSM